LTARRRQDLDPPAMLSSNQLKPDRWA